MATKNIVPRANGEGGIGTAAKGWGGAFFTSTATSSTSAGAKLQLISNDGAVMADTHQLGIIEFLGAEDSSGTISLGASIEAVADETFTASENASALVFKTTSGTTVSEVLRLDKNKLATFAGGVTMTGDLTVNGTTTTVNSTVTTVDDPIMTLGGDTAPGSDDNKDRGIEFRYHTGSSAKVGFFGFDDSASAFTFIPDATNSSEVFSGSVGNVIFNDVTAGSLDISGDADIDGTLEADAITVDGTTLAEFISDTTGAMFSSNTETGVTVTYQDADNTLDVAINAAQTTITSLLAADIKIGEDDQTKIDFETENEIHFYAANQQQINLVDGALVPVTDNDIDLGTSSLEFKDAFFDGTVTADAFAGPLTGNVTGNVSGTAATVTGAAQSNITSLGTLTTLTVDNVIINGTTIGHTGDTDLLTLTSGSLTVAGTQKISAATSQLTLNDSNSDSSGSSNVLKMTDSSDNVLFQIAQASGSLNAEINQVVNGSLTLKTNDTAALTLANNQNATFDGGVIINGGSNEVEINTNLLDINSSDNITVDATDDITITSGTASSQGLLTIAQAHKYGQIILNSSAEYQSDSSAIDGIKLICNTQPGTSKVTIDAGVANIQTKSRFAVNYPTTPASSYYIDLKVANSAGTLIQIGNTTSEVRCLDNLNVVGDGRIQSLAGSGNRAVFSTANGTLTNSSSDESLKENKEPIPYGLDSVLNLNPITFNWKDKVNFGSQKEIGFIAQEVQKEVPEVVGSDSEDKLTLEYAKLVPVLTKAIQDLEARVKSLEAK